MLSGPYVAGSVRASSSPWRGGVQGPDRGVSCPHAVARAPLGSATAFPSVLSRRSRCCSTDVSVGDDVGAQAATVDQSANRPQKRRSGVRLDATSKPGQCPASRKGLAPPPHPTSADPRARCVLAWRAIPNPSIGTVAPIGGEQLVVMRSSTITTPGQVSVSGRARALPRAGASTPRCCKSWPAVLYRVNRTWSQRCGNSIGVL
jgi:hypothetical protein